MAKTKVKTESIIEVEAPAVNGASDFVGEPQPKGYLDAERGMYVTRSGIELALVKVPYLVLERLLNDKSGRPKPPIVEVTIAGKYKNREANPNDPDYKQALGEWESEYQFRLFRYLFSKGVQCDVPSEFVKEHLEFFPGSSEAFLQYLFVCTLLEDDPDEIAALSDAIMGQTMPTQSGLEVSADQFQRDGKRLSD
jgi:hypothetical protein